MNNERVSISLKPLTIWGKILRGLSCTTVESALAVTEGIVVYHYNNNKKVSAEYLSLTNFVVAAITIYISIIVGNISDRAKGKYRRKQFVLFFVPLYAIGAFFRYGAFVNEKNAAAYYLISFALQIIGRSGLSIVNDAWNMELANEEVDRSNLYSITAALGVVGIILGLGFTALPLILNAFVLPILLCLANIANLIFVPEGTPLSKRCFIPTVANISSVLWNSQYCIYLLTMSFVWVLNSIPAILLFFLRYCVNQDEDQAKSAYTYCLIAFIFTGMCALPIVPKIIDKRGKLFASTIALSGLVVAGVIMFIVSYINVLLVIIVFGTVGFFSTMSNTVYNILAADCVDYDELLTGMKRASSYTGITNLPYMFISIAGSSIPLALMSSLGFEEPSDDNDNDSNDDGYSTRGSTLTLRIWCSCFVSFLGCCALIVMKFYKIDNKMHLKILENIFKRESTNMLNGQSLSIENPSSPIRLSENEFNEEMNTKLLLKDNNDNINEIPPTPEPNGIKLDSIDDPITEKPVAPPPYVVTLHAIEKILNNWETKGLSDEDKQAIKFLGYYFPHTISLCGTEDGLRAILLCSLLRYLSFGTIFGLGIWQTVVALINKNEFGLYLIVVLTTIYSCFLVWEFLHWKGYVKIIRETRRDNFKAVQDTFIKIGKEIENNVSVEHIPKYVTSKQKMIADTLYACGGITITFIAAYLALNL